MKDYKLIAEKQKELIQWFKDNCNVKGDIEAEDYINYRIVEAQIFKLESEFNIDINTPFFGNSGAKIEKQSEPDIDLAEMSFSEHFEKELSSSRHQENDKPKEHIEECMNCNKPFNTNEAGCICPKCFLVDCVTEDQPTERKTEEYVYARKINGSEEASGIIKIGNPPTLLCFCDEISANIILKAFTSQSLPEITDEEIFDAFKINAYSDSEYRSKQIHLREGAKWYRNEIKSRL